MPHQRSRLKNYILYILACIIPLSLFAPTDTEQLVISFFFQVTFATCFIALLLASKKFNIETNKQIQLGGIALSSLALITAIWYFCFSLNYKASFALLLVITLIPFVLFEHLKNNSKRNSPTS